jgi:hypothetical protein
MQKRKHTDAWKIHASEVAREWYHKNKERLKQERAKGNVDCEVMMGTNYPNKAAVRSSCNRVLKGAGFKNSEQVKDAIECVMDRERLERQKEKIKKIRRMIWGR